MRSKAFGFFTNPANQTATASVSAAIKKAVATGHDCFIDPSLVGSVDARVPEIGQYKPDVIIAFGGDGTILRAAGKAAELDVPVLGVNLGRIGFLSEIDPEKLTQAFAWLDADEFSLDSRMMLECRVADEEPHTCLNEALLYKHSFSGVVDISISINGVYAGSVFCDGLIISTPTGSTGYSISAGGPVITPGLDVVIITPICPHTLTFRPIIAPPDARMEFSLKNLGDLSLDGIYTREVRPTERIHIRRADKRVQFIRFTERNAYSLIRDKLS